MTQVGPAWVAVWLLAGGCGEDPPPPPVAESVGVEPPAVDAGEGVYKAIVEGHAAPPARPDIGEEVARNAADLQACYEARLKVAPDLAGRIELGWIVRADGAVEGLHLVSNDTGDLALGTCLTGKVKRWRFAPGDATEVERWPFVFRSR